MDIKARYILGEIRKVKGAEDSILAGGAARDSYFGIEPKDYDFFVPANVFEEVVSYFDKDWCNGRLMEDPRTGGTTEYGQNPKLNGVYDIELEGLPCQIIGHNVDKDQEFSEQVLRHFDYGINMIYYDGGPILRDTEEFQDDINNRTMTLHNLKGEDHLVKAILKFSRLDEKFGGGWKFRCPQITIELKEYQDDLDWLNSKTLKKSKHNTFSSTLYSNNIINQFRRAEELIREAQGIVVNNVEPEVQWDNEVRVQLNNNF